MEVEETVEDLEGEKVTVDDGVERGTVGKDVVLVSSTPEE